MSIGRVNPYPKSLDDKIEIWYSKNGWRTRVRSHNGKIVYAGESKASKGNCIKDAVNFARRHQNFKIIVLERNGEIRDVSPRI